MRNICLIIILLFQYVFNYYKFELYAGLAIAVALWIFFLVRYIKFVSFFKIIVMSLCQTISSSD